MLERNSNKRAIFGVEDLSFIKYDTAANDIFSVESWPELLASARFFSVIKNPSIGLVTIRILLVSQ